MREPQTWCDVRLLEDEPFVSAFKGCRTAGPPTRQCTGKDDDASKNDAIVNYIKDRNLLNIVQTWLNFAFGPRHGAETDKRGFKVEEPGAINLFVRFYRALSQDRKLAIDTLEKERRRRGNDYVLADIRTQQGASLASTVDLLKADTGLNEKAIDSQVRKRRRTASNARSAKNRRINAIASDNDDTHEAATKKLYNSQKKLKHLPSHAPVFPSPITPATNRGGYTATSRTTRPVKGKQEPRQINAVASNKVSGPTILDTFKKRNKLLSDLHFKRVPKPDTSQETEGKLQQGDPPVLDCRNNETPKGQDTSVPHIDGSVSKSSSDQFNTLAIDGRNPPSNSRKRLSSFDPPAPEEGDNAIVPKKISVERAEKATATSHEETKRRKIDREESTAEPVKDEAAAVPVPKRGKRKRTKQREPLKVESSERHSNKIEIHPATDRPSTTEYLFHQQDGMASNSRSCVSSSEVRHTHSHQEVAVVKKDSVPMTVQPGPVKIRRDSPPKVQRFKQEDSVSTIMHQTPPAKGGRARPPESKAPPSSPTQSNPGMAVPFSGQNVDIKQERSISADIPLPPVQRHDAPCSEETVEELSHTSNIPRSELDGDMKEEPIRSSENRLLAQEHSLVENYPGDIPPTQKPPLGVKPPIWAQSRQEICETFDWFRSYQGGVYFAHNVVKGYLLSAFSSKRDRFEHGGRLIISHGGGKAESFHTRKGQTTAQPATDQLAQDKSVRALLDNYRNQRPLVLLIDDKYVLFPYDLGARDMTYAVLGFYTIAHAWAEYQPANNETGRVVRYKFAFRWCDDQGSPWWLTDKEIYFSDLTPSTPINSIHKPASKRKPTKKNEDIQGTAVLCTTSSEPKSSVCMLCHMSSPRVYTCSWACLYPNCSKFWIDNQGNCLPNNLEYNSGFLKLMTSLPIPLDFGKLEPDPPPFPSTHGTVTNYAFTRGFHCKSCGRLSCRSKWEKWECMNCGEHLEVSRCVYKAKDFWSTLLPVGYKDHFISKISKIDQQPVRGFRHENGMGNIQSFILPGGRGKIHHIQPGTPLGRLEADEIFIEYQQQATTGVLKFRRWPLRSHKCRGALLSNYFSQNSGEPYQYVGGSGNTVPFEDAPSAVVRARALIRKRLQQALKIHVEFNEVLSAAYMERQKMAVGRRVYAATPPLSLSLGSPALMHFRIHVKHDPLREQKGNLLSFVLRHGDVLVMDGAGIQEYYEHTVIPSNFRIAATARQINPAHA